MIKQIIETSKSAESSKIRQVMYNELHIDGMWKINSVDKLKKYRLERNRDKNKKTAE